LPAPLPVATLEPTATDPGIRTYTCKICSETYEEEIPVVSCTHRYGTWKVVTPAKCEQEGLRTRSCVLCGDVQEEIIPAAKAPDKKQAAPAEETQGDDAMARLEALEAMMRDLPLHGLKNFSQGAFTKEMMEQIVQALNAIQR